MELARAIVDADARIRPLVRTTAVEFSHTLSEEGNAQVSLKLENQQLTGSFKLRGATNRLLMLTEEERRRGVVAASSGNHGAAVACAAAHLGTRALIFVPEFAAESKVRAIRARGAEVQHHGEDCVITEAHARAFATEHGMTYVSPYNDPAVVAGQGTVGIELHHQLKDLDAVFVALGGGGLISGIASHLRGVGRNVEVVACSPAHSAVMHASLGAGSILDLESRPTLSDGTAGGVEPGAITFDLCRELIDRSVVVEENEIADGVRRMVTDHHTLVEGAAGVAVAGYLQERSRYEGRSVAIVLCGANIDPRVLKEIL